MTERLIRSAADWIAVWRARMAELGLTCLEADARAGLSEGHTSKILCGLRKPSGETRDRLCTALGLLQSVSVDIAAGRNKIASDGRSSFEANQERGENQKIGGNHDEHHPLDTGSRTGGTSREIGS